MECPVGDGSDSRKNEGSEYCSEESMYFKSFHQSAQEPEEESIDYKGKDTECQKIDRKGQNQENRFDSHVHYPPQQGENKGCCNPLHRDATYDMRKQKKGSRTYQPFNQKHNIIVKKLCFHYTTPCQLLGGETAK